MLCKKLKKEDANTKEHHGPINYISGPYRAIQNIERPYESIGTIIWAIGVHSALLIGQRARASAHMPDSSAKTSALL